MEVNHFMYALKHITGFAASCLATLKKYCTHYVELGLRNTASRRRVFRYAFEYSLTVNELIFAIFTLTQHII